MKFRDARHARARVRISVVAIAALIVGGLTASPVGAAAGRGAEGNGPAGGKAAALQSGGKPVRITLITGDTVTYSRDAAGHISATVTAGAGRDDVVFNVRTEKDGYYLYPSDVEQYVHAGLLDKELFNVSYLATNGYADEATGHLQVIAQYAAGTARATITRKAKALPGRVASATLSSVHGAAVRVDKKRAGAFWTAVRGSAANAIERPLQSRPAHTAPPRLGSDVAKLWLDARVKATDDVSAAQIGAPIAWAAGLDGTGMSVGIIDTGIDSTHPDLTGKVTAAKNFVPTGEPGGGDPSNVTDRHGHGTHVASIVAGTGAASGGTYKGVAYGAMLTIAKGLSDIGSGSDSTIIAAMEWQAATQHARIVSMSLGGGPTDGTDPLSQAVDDLSARYGTLFVIAAGNSGPDRGTVSAPGAASAALTVGAVDSDDHLAYFSSRGPRHGTDYAVKPEITAPGVRIIAGRAAGTSLGGVVDEYYTKLSGTSMATPHVAAAAAALLQRHPDWTGVQLKNALVGTAKDTGDNAYEQGAGRLDLGRAVTQQVFADTASVSAGFTYPYTDQTLTRQVTYHNLGSEPITLAVSPTVRSLAGAPAPDGMISVSPTSVTVPAGESASVRLTIDPTFGDPGFYAGQLVATGSDGDRVTVPVGFRKSVKMRTLRVRIVGGGAFPVFGPDLVGAALLNDDDPMLKDEEHIYLEGGWRLIDDDTAEVSMLVPEGGVYMVDTRMSVGSATDDQVQWAVLVRPEVKVDQDTIVTFRADELAPVRFNTPQPSQCAIANFLWWHTAASGMAYFGGSLHSWGPCARWTVWFSPSAESTTIGKFHLQIDHTRIAPQLSVALSGDNAHLNLMPWYNTEFSGVPKFTADQHVTVAPEASLRDGTNVRGKLILMDPLPWGGWNTPANERFLSVLDLAERAGAVGVLTDSSYFWHSTSEWRAAHPHTPIAWVPDAVADQARKMLASAASLQADIHGQLISPYEYKLIQYFDDQIPASLTFSPEMKSLARINVTYHAEYSSNLPFGRAADANEVNNAFRPTQWFSIKASHSFATQTRRTEYFNVTGPDVLWDRDYSFDNYATGAVRVASTERAFTAPTIEQEDWNEGSAPAQRRPGPDRPALGYFDIPCDGCRQGDVVRLRSLHSLGFGEFSNLSDSSQVAADDEGTIEEGHLFRGDEEIQPEYDQYGLPLFTVAADEATYRFTDEYVEKFRAPHTATKVTSTWTFRSSRPASSTVSSPYVCIDTLLYGDSNACAWLPLIYLNYRFGLAPDDTAPAGRPFAFTVNADTGQGGVAPTGLRVWISADRGGHWTEATVVPGPDHTFQVVVTNPTLAASPSDTVTVRTEAWDGNANSIKQIITDAYRLTAPEPAVRAGGVLE